MKTKKQLEKLYSQRREPCSLSFLDDFSVIARDKTKSTKALLKTLSMNELTMNSVGSKKPDLKNNCNIDSRLIDKKKYEEWLEKYLDQSLSFKLHHPSDRTRKDRKSVGVENIF